MLDALIPQIDELRAQGAVVLLKWDGERKGQACTIVISRQDTDYFWRQDVDSIAAGLESALHDYKTRHAR